MSAQTQLTHAIAAGRQQLPILLVLALLRSMHGAQPQVKPLVAIPINNRRTTPALRTCCSPRRNS